MSLFTVPITVRHPGGPTGVEDGYGIPVIGPPTERTEYCWYEPRGSSEDSTGKLQKIDGYLVYLPGGTVIDADDAIKINGKWYELDGDPGETPDGFILDGFLTLEVRRVTG